MGAWSTPVDLVEQVRRWWLRGDLLVGSGEPFPRSVKLCAPKPSDLSFRFAEVQAWSRTWKEGCKDVRGFGYDLLWHQVRNQKLGEQSTPSTAVIVSVDDALALGGYREEADRWLTLRYITQRVCPELVAWADASPLVVLAQGQQWEVLMAVIRWFIDHPEVSCYLRQIDAPGVHTKFIEQNALFIAKLLDCVLPPERIRKDIVASRSFELRYGLRADQQRIRFRLLDPTMDLMGLRDAEVPLEQFGNMNPAVTTVFIVENKINGLAFPDYAKGLVIFGLGYGVEALHAVSWLADKEIVYWGDIDMHGFSMLGRLRRAFPHVSSLLMDETTLSAHLGLCSVDDEQIEGEIDGLEPAEAALYWALQTNVYGTRVRLEQERIPFSLVETWLATRAAASLPSGA